MRAHLARFDEHGAIAPYSEWEFQTHRTIAGDPGTALFPTGVAGVLYFPGSLSSEVLNEQAFLELCPYADDVWFFWMQRLIGTRQVRVPGHFDLINWPDSQAQGLFVENLHQHRNDVQLRAVEARYGRIGPNRHARTADKERPALQP
jgi:hypothetical protein